MVVFYTVSRICRLNHDKHVNAIKEYVWHKFSKLVLQNGLNGNLVGTWEGKRHDCTILYGSSLLDDHQKVA